MSKYTEHEILDNLERRGFQLVHPEDFPSQNEIPFAELFQFMVANPNKANYLAIPVILATAEHHEISGMVSAARDVGQQNITGYFLETVSELLKDYRNRRSSELLEASEALYPPDAEEYIYHWGFESPYTIEWTRESRTFLARKWNVVEFNAQLNFEEMIKIYVVGQSGGGSG